jgi:enediyne polyketide synthase
MTQRSDIAISALACRYPDAATPEALWSNVLEGRRSFRALPPERIDLDGYRGDRVGEADSIAPIRAGLISDWAFDRARFRIPQAHWLALEVAAQAIEAIGGPGAVEPERVAVVVANTLTGEFSRANSLRLRLPFLDGVVAQACDRLGLDDADALDLRREFGTVLRDRLAEPNEETLAGGLANTIAGRIANYFDFKAGAYVIDAACASSLVALADAAGLIETGAADVVLVVAVDLSLDPFELVGFSRNGALATENMWVFDARSSGFWPGEGAGAAVLARGADVARRGLPRVASLRGWGISTDGAGGLTRPDCDGQHRALTRAYAKAAADPADLMMVEAHGTGTAVGDPTEIRALARLAEGRRSPLAVGSIKANIGHTKAAAGLAGLIKAVFALNAGIVPPHVGCEVPHPVFDEAGNRVYPVQDPAMAPPQRRAIAGVSGFGFGGINAHVVVEAGQRRRCGAAFLPARPRHQDVELFLFSAASRADLLTRLDVAAARAPSLSMSEFVDLSSHCARHAGTLEHRLAIVASDPEQFCARSEQARQALVGDGAAADGLPGVLLGQASGPARIGFLFSGQAAPLRPAGGIWARRFELARDALASVPAAAAGADSQDTAIGQPTIAAASLAALRILEACGVAAVAATGHSLGEVTALAWAQAVERNDLVALTARRGAIMSEFGEPGGAMLLLRCAPPMCRDLIAELELVVACENAAQETVVSGRADRIAELARRTRAAGIEAARLPVSHAFHSPLMAKAAPRFGCALGGFSLRAPGRRVLSPTLGRQVTDDDDLRRLLVRQFVAPVRFDAALAALACETDLVIELGPGAGLSRLAAAQGVPSLSVDAFAETLAPLLNALGAAFCCGVELDPDPLYSDRPVRAIDLAARPQFLANPCGNPDGVVPPAEIVAPVPPTGIGPPPTNDPAPDTASPLAAVLAAVAEATGLPEAGLAPALRFLEDLHLNSLAVGRIVATACAGLGIAVPQVLTDYAGASLEELADNLGELARLGDERAPGRDAVAGVAPWIACFRPVAETAVTRPGGAPLSWRIRPVGAPARFEPPPGIE